MQIAQANTHIQTETLQTRSDPIVRPLPSPLALKQARPLSHEMAQRIDDHRQQVRAILQGTDDRLMVITGPCSLHDEVAALDYAKKLKQISEQVSDKILIVMRAYVEKPRTTTGWKGLAYDPLRDGKGDIEQGLNRSRELMLNLIELDLPLATEALNPMTMHYLEDLITWTAIGARTAESQIHREMISHLNMPVGIKNGTDGSVDTAVNAMISASRAHHCLGMDCHGNIAMFDTPGNPDTHVVLRGGRNLTNYDAQSIALTLEKLDQAKKENQIHAKVIVDCSHDNAEKKHENQLPIAQEVVQQIVNGNKSISGIMLESFLEPGKQSMAGCEHDGCLKYGMSITDACIGWEQTVQLLQQLHVSLTEPLSLK
ncbi:MAG: 3-deoxy-7-phosphoheptulonate synthase [Bermanella sp.]|jgi:3-deoxy-7-phosphoheptulonate synthase